MHNQRGILSMDRIRNVFWLREENIIPLRIRFVCARGVASIGTLCYLAANPRNELVGEGTAKWIGLAFFLLSGLF